MPDLDTDLYRAGMPYGAAALLAEFSVDLAFHLALKILDLAQQLTV
jgi:hypothetical protein